MPEMHRQLCSSDGHRTHLIQKYNDYLESNISSHIHLALLFPMCLSGPFDGLRSFSRLFFRASPSLPLASPNLRNVLLAEETTLPDVSTWLFLLMLVDQRSLNIRWFHPRLAVPLVS